MRYCLCWVRLFEEKRELHEQKFTAINLLEMRLCSFSIVKKWEMYSK